MKLKTLVLAKNKKVGVILDDKEARAIAEGWRIQYTGTVMIVYEAFVKNLISYDELIGDLGKLAKIMWISTDVITEIIRRAGRGVEKR